MSNWIRYPFIAIGVIVLVAMIGGLIYAMI